MLRSKWTCCLCLTLLGTTPSLSSPRRDGEQKDAVAEYREIAFRLYRENLIVVKGTIGSVEDANIVLDTGTNPTIISREVANRMQLRGHNEKLASSSGQMNVQSVILPGMDIGALHRQPLRAVVQDLSVVQAGLGIRIDAIAGLDILSASSFMIDYGKKSIAFASAQPSKKSARFQRQGPYLTISANISGETFRLLVDSGTPGLLLFRDRLHGKAVKLQPVIGRPKLSMFTPVSGMRAEWRRVSEVSIGEEKIGPQIVLVADGNAPDSSYEFDGLLGLAKTGFQKVWFDFDHGLFGWE